jgi:arylsulfatase A
MKITFESLALPLLLAPSLLLLSSACASLEAGGSGDGRPNILLILTDDLGYSELGSYGQTHIRTPRLDRLAAEGMRFTDHHSGSPVCAPSRCVLLTGLHTGHAFIRGNKEMGGWGPDEPEGQLPLPEDTTTLARLLQERGYATAAIGKWGLGGPGSSGHPNRQGFDHFYGYLCQRVAHNYYPTHLWRNEERDLLEGNEWFSAHQKLAEVPADLEAYSRFEGKQYAPDLLLDEALEFLSAHRNEPFFLYFATPVPHVAIQVPADSLSEYAGSFADEPYLGKRGYLPHPEPRAGYAAMVTRMDRDIGCLLDRLEELGIADDTIVIFTSDNGPTFNGGTDSAFFESAAPFRGLKCSVYEGGIRVPMIVRWPGRIAPDSSSDLLSGFQDFLPTLQELTGGEAPRETDGISLAPTLLGRGEQREHEAMYWEYPEADGQQALRLGKWKVVRRGLRKGEGTFALYDLATDPAESHDLAAEHPELVEELRIRLAESRRRSDDFPLAGLD